MTRERAGSSARRIPRCERSRSPRAEDAGRIKRCRFPDGPARAGQAGYGPRGRVAHTYPPRPRYRSTRDRPIQGTRRVSHVARRRAQTSDTRTASSQLRVVLTSEIPREFSAGEGTPCACTTDGAAEVAGARFGCCIRPFYYSSANSISIACTSVPASSSE